MLVDVVEFIVLGAVLVVVFGVLLVGLLALLAPFFAVGSAAMKAHRKTTGYQVKQVEKRVRNAARELDDAYEQARVRMVAAAEEKKP